ncbi:MAG: hypothetical protein KA146_02765 [Leptospiraceae bacterium]|jgi:hypothetical protein|nr:hypothetical protein [Leptospiraceae bacterium]
MNGRTHYDSVFGGSNPKDIPVGTNSIVDCITIANDRGRNYTVKGFVLRFAPGLEDCTAELYYNLEVKFITGDNQLTALGNTKVAAVPRDEFPVNIPFDNNSKIVMKINPKGLLIKTGDITITLLATDEKFTK